MKEFLKSAQNWLSCQYELGVLLFLEHGVHDVKSLYVDILEAVRAIIVYTDNPAELLRRKKVRREVLFKYADQEQIPVKPDDEKLTLIQRILHYLGSRPLPVGYDVVWIDCFFTVNGC